MRLLKGLWDSVNVAVGRGRIDEELFESLEEALLEADTGYEVTEEILDEVRQAIRTQGLTQPEQVVHAVKYAVAERFLNVEGNPHIRVGPQKPTVYLFVGVNGVGKTTTIGKMAHGLVRAGNKVMLAAGDTFRAAAIEQLTVWAERTGSEIVKSQPNSDSAAVIFDAIQSAKSRGVDYVLADTSGRQHTKGSLMSELGKVVKVAERALERPLDEVLLVLDANTGQNALRQAEEFTAAVGVTGLVITKLDGAARGGALLGVNKKLKVPVKLVGLGEKPEDLIRFEPKMFVEQLVQS